MCTGAQITTLFQMKKRMIPAGILFLLLACSQSNKESVQAFKESNTQRPIADEEEAQPPANSEGTLDLLDATSNRNENSDNSLSDRQVTAQFDMSSAALVSSGSEKTKPDVGRAISSSAAIQGSDTTHKFIRTADLRFRVKDVVKATIGIEDIVGAHKGWVTKTQLRSESRGQELVSVSADSILEISRYELINTITLRVPNTELDSTLRQIGRWVDLFEHRDILADDIRLRMMANAMAVRRAKAHSLRVTAAIDDQGRKLKETLAAEEALQASDERRDQGILNNMDLNDRVAYSTVSVDIFQRPLVRKEMIANERSIEGYRPSLWNRIGTSLRDGWNLVELMVVGLLSIWPVVLLMIGALWLLWRNSRKRKPMPPVPPAQ